MADRKEYFTRELSVRILHSLIKDFDVIVNRNHYKILVNNIQNILARSSRDFCEDVTDSLTDALLEKNASLPKGRHATKKWLLEQLNKF